MTDMHNRLSGIRVAVPESRQLDTMVQLLLRRGAEVLRVPLVAIHDAPDPEPVLAWIRRFIGMPPDLFIIFTGEGLRRLLSLADRHGLSAELSTALNNVTLLCRGPKPERVLREAGIGKGDIQAREPTTDGVLETLAGMNIEGQRIAVQLYGEDPNPPLMAYLDSRKVKIDVVAPYVYADEAEETSVVSLIRDIAAHRIDAIAFTSQPQFKRLKQVAGKHQLEKELTEGLNQCCVAAVGPLVRDQLWENGIQVDIMPAQSFFMKPLVTEIMRHFNSLTDAGNS